MRNETPLRWIEQREARQVIATAVFERAPKAPWSEPADRTNSQWLPRIGSWLAARHPMGAPVPQLQPVLVRGPKVRSEEDDNGYRCNW